MSCRTPNIAFAWKIARARRLKPNERLIYFAIAERARGEALECWPTLPQLAADTGLSPRAAHTAVHKLNARGDLITIERRFDGLHYFFKRTDAETAQESQESSPKPVVTLFPDVDAPEDVAASELHDLQDAPPPKPVLVASSELQIVQDAQPSSEGGNLQDLQDAYCTSCKTSNEYPQVPPKQESKEEGSLRSPPAHARAGARTRGTRLPSDWTLPDAERAYAVARGVDPDLAAEEFRNYWSARPGSGAVKLDWPATFRNRVLDHQQRGRFPLGGARVIPIARGVRVDPRDAEYRRRLEDIERIGRRFGNDGPIIDGKVMA